MTRDHRTPAQRREAIRRAVALTAASTVPLGFPALVRAQADTIKLGYLMARTDSPSQAGEHAFRGAQLAVEEANAAGGVRGRKIELIAEDIVSPATARTQAQQLVERDQVICLVGGVSTACALAIGAAALRYKLPYFNTGTHSDALRGPNCNRYMFHIDGCSTLYAKTIGTWQKQHNLIRGASWYFLTGEHALGQDLYRGSARFLRENGGVVLANDIVPINTADYGIYLRKIGSLKPDFVYLNLVDRDQTRFLKQYKEYNLPFPLGGAVMDTMQFWAAGLENLSGHWPCLWYHGLQAQGAQAFTKRFMTRYGHPPARQAWGDYIGVRIVLQTLGETNKTDADSIVAHLLKGASFDLLKERKGNFRNWDHQLLQEMYVVKVKDKARSKDQWDTFEIVRAMPGPNESLELIQPTQSENPCQMA